MQARKAKKNKNDNTTSPAPEQHAIQPASSLKQKLAMASDVISRRLNPENNKVPNNVNVKDYSPHNPPVVILTDGTNISTCKGCGKKNTKEQRKYPNNMVFRKKRHNGIPPPGQIHFQNWKHTLSLAKRMFEAS